MDYALYWLQHLRRLNNFNSYLAILSAVDSAPVRRLEWPKPNIEVCMMCTCIYFISSTPGGCKVFVMTIPVCSHISKTTWVNYVKFFVHVACGCCSVLLWWRCETLCISCFVDNIIFWHCGLCGASCVFISSESITTKLLHQFQPNFVQWQWSSSTHRGLCTGNKLCYLQMPCYLLICFDFHLYHLWQRYCFDCHLFVC